METISVFWYVFEMDVFKSYYVVWKPEAIPQVEAMEKNV